MRVKNLFLFDCEHSQEVERLVLRMPKPNSKDLLSQLELLFDLQYQIDVAEFLLLFFEVLHPRRFIRW
jgi:hypothetical protein